MELEAKEKALEALKAVVKGGFKGVERILTIKGEVVKATGDISDVRYGEIYDLDKAAERIKATSLISLLIDETELVKVRDDIEDDGSITYTFKLESPSRILALELMIAWVDNR